MGGTKYPGRETGLWRGYPPLDRGQSPLSVRASMMIDAVRPLSHSYFTAGEVEYTEEFGA